MSGLPHYSVYDGRTFMGSLVQDASGTWTVKGQTFKTIGKFGAKRDAIAAIVSRYAVPRDERAAVSKARSI